MSLVARGRIVHPTMSGVEMFGRADITLVPLTGLPPMPIGLVWCTAHENARIRALAATAESIAVRPATVGPTTVPPTTGGPAVDPSSVTGPSS
jgi:hypothetical protein